ncbi:hypothetical protein [Campylobacter sp. RKI_CA19_01127]|uniref:hypothetical protein n=1 Tax=Campylobacter sp. RKI_CA19_01127 TaxID=2911628 RepID=UPI0021E9772B|nr:hypothetical protein [Campylobacter sp. RKI_CA19_01127]MCV3349765.1 hypothetical protein [Campylobacter sp. RKI_CA19_01127]
MKRFYILFLSALIFAPSLLFSWGYGEVANDILKAIKGITSGADYMVKIVMAIAFFTFAIKKVMDERTSPIFEFGKMIFIMVIIWQCFLRAPNDAQHRYMIHDNVTGKDYIVSQVPLGIGLTFSFMSRMEDSITKNHNISSEWSKNLSNSDSTAYAKMVGYADSFSQTQSAIQAVTSNNMDNVVNAYARDLATIDNKDFNTLSVAEQNTYFAKAGNQISDMIKNDPASISNYASQYGAGSNVGENTITSPNALNKEFANVGGNTLLNHNLNQEQVNSRAKDMRSNSNIPNAKDIKEVASGSNINKEVGGKLETADKILHFGLGDKKGI